MKSSFDRIVPLQRIAGLVSDQAVLHRYLAHFDVDFYRNHEHLSGVKDLQHLSPEDAVVHFVRRGQHEGRSYNKWFHSFIDPVFYQQKYPELQLKDHGEAIRHWMYCGAYEKRVPNSVTEQLLSANIHLFQMAKVGSKSIQKSLEAAGHKQIVPHLHFADELAFSYPDSFFSYPEIINYDKKKPLLFISGVRNPAERLISGYFEAFHGWTSNNPFDEKKFSVNKVISSCKKQKSRLLNWFDHKYFSDIDIYKYDFDKKVGYSLIRKKNITVFIYRLENLDKCWSVLRKITGLKLRPRFDNQSKNKSYAQYYGAARTKEALHSILHKECVDSKYWKHFYEE